MARRSKRTGTGKGEYDVPRLRAPYFSQTSKKRRGKEQDEAVQKKKEKKEKTERVPHLQAAELAISFVRFSPSLALAATSTNKKARETGESVTGGEG
jgi:hypothetical protein